MIGVRCDDVQGHDVRLAVLDDLFLIYLMVELSIKEPSKGADSLKDRAELDDRPSEALRRNKRRTQLCEYRSGCKSRVKMNDPGSQLNRP